MDIKYLIIIIIWIGVVIYYFILKKIPKKLPDELTDKNTKIISQTIKIPFAINKRNPITNSAYFMSVPIEVIDSIVPEKLQSDEINYDSIYSNNLLVNILENDNNISSFIERKKMAIEDEENKKIGSYDSNLFDKLENLDQYLEKNTKAKRKKPKKNKENNSIDIEYFRKMQEDIEKQYLEFLSSNEDTP